MLHFWYLLNVRIELQTMLVNVGENSSSGIVSSTSKRVIEGEKREREIKTFTHLFKINK